MTVPVPTPKVTEILLRRLQVAGGIQITSDMVADVRHVEEFDSYFVTLKRRVLGQTLGEKIVRYPRNWKEAFKERWFPNWLKRRFPVKYQEYDALVVFPQLLQKYPLPLSIRREPHYFAFVEPEEE